MNNSLYRNPEYFFGYLDPYRFSGFPYSKCVNLIGETEAMANESRLPPCAADAASEDHFRGVGTTKHVLVPVKKATHRR